jgi:signal transduction histidine kinase
MGLLERWSSHPIRVVGLGVAVTLLLFGLLAWTLWEAAGTLTTRSMLLAASTAVAGLGLLFAAWLAILLLLRWHLLTRKRAERELRRAHEELEQRISDRTAHLASANEELGHEVGRRARAEARLAEATAQLTRLARHRMHIEEELRHEIARELHDELGQSLTVLLFDVQRRAAREGMAALWSDVVDGLRRMIGVVRKISYGLRPPELDTLGLARSLESLAASVDDANLAVEVGVRFRRRLLPAYELCLYRVAQEALRNAMQHGHATRVRISSAMVPGAVVLSVTDNGRGYDTTKPQQSPAQNFGGLGLIGMRERVAECGGTLTVRSKRGFGTRIVARLPSNR